MTYTLIDSVTLTSSASSVTFSGISATGKGDLVLLANPIASATNVYAMITFNSDNGSNYNRVVMTGNGSSATSAVNPNVTYIDPQLQISSGNTALIQIQVSDYSATDKHKSALIRSGSTTERVTAIAARWANTSAITSITLNALTNSYAVGSTFHLYQIVSE